MPLTSPAILRCYGIVGLFFFFPLLFQQIAWWPFLIKSYESLQKLQPSPCSAQNNVLSNTMYYWNSNFLAAVIWVCSQLSHTPPPWQQVWYPLGEQSRRLEERSSPISILEVSLRAKILHLRKALDLHESYTCLFMHVYFLHREYCVPWNKTQVLRIYWEYICSSAMED